MQVIEYILISPYIAGCIFLVSSLFLRVKRDHLTMPLSELWRPQKYPLGVITIDKRCLTEKGLLLHAKFIRRVWWFVRLTLLGLLLNLAYALFPQ
jgi:hypothetical protein